MDVIIASHDRPQRLAATLGSLISQEVSEKLHLFIVDSSCEGLLRHKPLEKILKVFETRGWTITIDRTTLRTISEIKYFALQQGQDEHLVAIDNDVLFTRSDTLQAILEVLTYYDVAAVSPIAFDADDERPILKNDEYLYYVSQPDGNGVAEGLAALGLCIGMNRTDLQSVIHFWCCDFPYMEDQVLIHFLKKRRGYAHLHSHVVYHLSVNETPSYVFDKEEVLKYFSDRALYEKEFREIVDLRKQDLDAAAFRKPLERRVACDTGGDHNT